MANVEVSIIIVSYNTATLLKDCIESIKKFTKGVSYEILVIDNASTDNTVPFLKKITNGTIRCVFNKKNVGFAEANNQGMKIAKGKYLLLLNSDTFLTEDSISKITNECNSDETIGIASCQLRNVDNSIQPSGGFAPTPFRLALWMFFIDDLPFVGSIVGSYHPEKSFFKESHFQDWVTGAFFLIRKQVVEDIGYFDPEYFMYVEEMDYCSRARAKGWKVWFSAGSSIVHIGQASGSNEFALSQEMKNIRLFYKKHMSVWYPFSFLVVKVGSLIRSIIFAILGRSTQSRIYAAIFKKTQYAL